ncbi:MAG: hypothetical protein M3405_06540 [Acidobacteriota bacterium]|jgi:hypothetical protein|nr:hypothetical protein [Acidobacteriota bacterium]
MEKPEYIYWMPTNKPSFILPYQYQFQVATVIKAVKGQKMGSDIYFSLLSDRVQHLIDENDEPEDAMIYTFNVLESSNLIYEKPSGLYTVGEEFVFQNFKLREHLHSAGVFETMPTELNENNLEAEEFFNQTDLENWFSAVTTILSEEYR